MIPLYSAAIAVLAVAEGIAAWERVPLAWIPWGFAAFFALMIALERRPRWLLVMGKAVPGRVVEVFRSRGAISVKYEYMTPLGTLRYTEGFDAGRLVRELGRRLAVGDRVVVVYDERQPSRSVIWDLLDQAPPSGETNT